MSFNSGADMHDPEMHGCHDLEKDITGHCQDAEHTILEMIEDHQIAGLKDPEVWTIVDGFMDRVVNLLSYLEKIHEQCRPQGTSSKLESLQEQTDENGGQGDENDEDGDWNGEYGHDQDQEQDHDQGHGADQENGHGHDQDGYQGGGHGHDQDGYQGGGYEHDQDDYQGCGHDQDGYQGSGHGNGQDVFQGHGDDGY